MQSRSGWPRRSRCLTLRLIIKFGPVRWFLGYHCGGKCRARRARRREPGRVSQTHTRQRHCRWIVLRAVAAGKKSTRSSVSWTTGTPPRGAQSTLCGGMDTAQTPTRGRACQGAAMKSSAITSLLEAPPKPWPSTATPVISAPPIHTPGCPVRAKSDGLPRPVGKMLHTAAVARVGGATNTPRQPTRGPQLSSRGPAAQQKWFMAQTTMTRSWIRIPMILATRGATQLLAQRLTL